MNNIEKYEAELDTNQSVLSNTTELIKSRQMQEVQAAMIIAKKFPRNDIESWQRIKRACQRKSLAEKATYSYPRGKEIVTGPSIRLAEVLAQNWGNIDFGTIELSNDGNTSQWMSYAWDLETNTRQTKIINVEHRRVTKNGSYELKDPRDIYELGANYAARRLRNCILGIIPGNIVEMAMLQCNQTLVDDAGMPLPDIIRDVAEKFHTDFSIQLSDLENYIGYSNSNFVMNDLIKLKQIYNALQDGVAKREDFFTFVNKDDNIVNPFDDVEKPEKKKGKKKNEIDGQQLLQPE